MSILKSADTASRIQIETPLDEQLSINLRQCCIDCPFVISCPVAQQKGNPDIDVLLGSYRVSALKDRCLL